MYGSAERFKLNSTKTPKIPEFQKLTDDKEKFENK